MLINPTNRRGGTFVLLLHHDAGSTLGAAAAHHLSNEGAIGVIGAADVDRVRELAHELRWNGGKSVGVCVDPGDSTQLEHLLAAAVQAFGRVDVIVNNAGSNLGAPRVERRLGTWEQVIDLNLKGMLYGTAAALPHMQRQRLGQIINVPRCRASTRGAPFAAPRRGSRCAV